MFGPDIYLTSYQNHRLMSFVHRLEFPINREQKLRSMYTNTQPFLHVKSAIGIRFNQNWKESTHSNTIPNIGFRKICSVIPRLLQVVRRKGRQRDGE